MATDYVLFIHGVNVRNRAAYETQARAMFQTIKATLNNPSRTLKPVILYWGNVGEPSTNALLRGLESSSKWKDLWFQDLRRTQVLPFVGDAAMYLSRYISSATVQQIANQAFEQMGLPLEELINPPAGDRLHLVTHSWGTVVLFDILFATRWEDPDLFPSVRDLVGNIRLGFFGVGSATEKNYGIPLASIHTMGSPIALFNLINVGGPVSFDLTPKLQEFLEALQAKMQKPLTWKNYAHPGDPIAYPLEGVMPLLLDKAQKLVDIEDLMSPSGLIGGLFGQTIFPILNGGKAHGSYWTEPKVARAIGKVIQSTQG
ncbi:MAG: hypothetical protein HC852_18450 [Acaryochloridaceae cyanobacterium RU_4_10]|jgi:hypothetical protein|nr:hypothetical protein [Acaryochloridaceae cyanobacterium RU_4_10]